jgi:protein phosphatase
MMEHSMQFDAQVYGNLPFRWAVCSDTGRVRQVNEDAHLVEPETGLFVVSDGMGGHPGGEVASDFVAENLSVRIETGLHKMRPQSPRAVRNLLKKAVGFHSRELYHEGQSESAPAGMGATVVLCLLLAGRCYVVNVGDSRLYRLHLHPDDAFGHPDSAIITQYMGMDKKTRPHIRSFKLHPGDRLLLCTDGLTDMLSDRTIKKTLSAALPLEQSAQSLVKQANEMGGCDNTTVIVIDWSGKAC